MSHIQKYKEFLFHYNDACMNPRYGVLDDIIAMNGIPTPESYICNRLYDSDFRLIGVEGVIALYGDLCIIYYESSCKESPSDAVKRDWFQRYSKTLTYEQTRFNIAWRGLCIALMDELNRFFRRWNPWR